MKTVTLLREAEHRRTYAFVFDDPRGSPARRESVANARGDRHRMAHWLVTGLPPTTTSLGRDATLPHAAAVQKNDKGTSGYAGPCPPSGRHHYQFRVYALDTTLPTAMTRAEFVNTVGGHILATGQLVGTYQKHARGQAR